MRKIYLLSFIFLAPVTFILSFALLFFTISQNQISVLAATNKQKIAYAAIPEDSYTLKSNVKGIDARVEAVKDFFSYYKSDLTPFAQDVVDAADKYDLDYRLIPAIAMEESTLCNNLPKKYKGTHNCWGFGIYGGKVTSFDSFPHAIDIITKTLATKYKAQGLETPEEIMSKYNPVSVNGSWANGISTFMERLSISL